jgi:hypothetical protein
MNKQSELTGRRFGRLVVIEHAGSSRQGARLWRCNCDCGKEVIIRADNLRNAKSCGCTRGRGPTHGHAQNGRRTATYNAWKDMLTRCNCKTNKRYADYGGRGIQVCERWQKFTNFLADMGKRPDGMSLDRINNSLGYSPHNCRWATRSEQQRNRRGNHILEHDGEKQCVAAWAERLSMKESTIKTRLRRGWTVDKALTPPTAKRGDPISSQMQKLQ